MICRPRIIIRPYLFLLKKQNISPIKHSLSSWILSRKKSRRIKRYINRLFRSQRCWKYSLSLRKDTLTINHVRNSSLSSLTFSAIAKTRVSVSPNSWPLLLRIFLSNSRVDGREWDKISISQIKAIFESSV